MMGQLASAVMTNVNGSTWAAGYNYTKDGNVSYQTGSNASIYSFDGDLMTGLNSNTLTWDDNGRLTGGIADSFTCNLDGRLKTGGTVPTDYIDLAYDPMNNRVYKKSVVPGQGESSVTTETQYIVDIVGGLPTILCEFDLDDSSLTYSYIYAESQVLTQLEHGYDSQAEVFTLEDRLFYLHDRLGSIREVVDFDDISPVDGIEDTPVVVAGYTYNPYGQDHSSECFENTGLHNPFKYTGQWYDPEISQYYLRARMYDPQLMRFTGRDSHERIYEIPFSLHRYLYCWNDPVNMIDLKGEFPGSFSETLTVMGTRAMVGANLGFVQGVFVGLLGELTDGEDGINAFEVLERGVKGSLTGVITGLALGVRTPGLDHFLEHGGKQILSDFAISLFANGLAEIIEEHSGINDISGISATYHTGLNAAIEAWF
jgi:RHS repeat-associated protein